MHKVFKRILFVAGLVVSSTIVLAGGYVSYVLLSYNRIGDKPLNIGHRSLLGKVKNGQEYKALSYNIGFGAYSQDYTFFLDSGYDDAGNPTCGYWSKARSKETVNFNVTGAIATVHAENPDFVLWQEVDTDSTRSYHIDQDKRIVEAFPEYDHIHAINFHTAFLPYPLYDMHGSVNSGLTTLSKYPVVSAERKQYTVSSSISKIFDLDRCFAVSAIPVENGKILYLVNSHMSAYDEGGTVRHKQVEELNVFLSMARMSGDYVVIGGDWNHDLLSYNSTDEYKVGGQFKYDNVHRPFGMTKKAPDWMNYYFDQTGKSPLIEGYSVVASDNAPTCRNNDIPYKPGETFVCTVDGFIVSDNVKVLSHRTIQTKNTVELGRDGFMYSDHDPTMISFSLIA